VSDQSNTAEPKLADPDARGVDGGAAGARAVAPTVVSDRDDCVPRSYYRAPDGTVRRDLHPREFAAIRSSGVGTLWVDVDSTNAAQHALLEKVFRFHPLAIEDTLHPNSRVKYDEYDGYLFVIVRAVKLAHETPDPYDLDTVNICFFLGSNYLVTVHADHSDALREMLERAGRTDMHGVLDVTIDAFFPVLDEIDDFVDGLEQRVFVEFDQTALRDVFAVKRLVLSLRRHLAPQREVLNQLTNRPSEYLPPSAQLYFRDVYDHVLRINDALDTYRELLSSTMDSYLSQVSNRAALASKALGAVATITLPFVIVSGMWGMNFERIPMAGKPYGFWLLVFVQLAIAVGLLGILRWRRVL
jgi:magnesium transporter